MSETCEGLTARLARAIVAARPREDARAMAQAREAFVDVFACLFGGARDASTTLLVETLGGTGPVPLIGRSETLDPAGAALVNAHAAHVLDYDDVHSSVRGHPTAVIVPALLAAAHGRAIGAGPLLEAYVVGLETMARLGLSLGAAHYERGFHATGTLGTLAAAAAVARLLNLTPERTAVALGLGATQSSGLRAQFGHDAKPLHAGFAARAGLEAARLAAAGFDGAPDILDGPLAFQAVFGFGAERPERAVEGWGAPWQIDEPGLVFKAYPFCTAAHPVAVGALALRENHGLAAADIAELTLTFPRGGDAALVYARPRTGLEARFSPEYVAALAFSQGGFPLGVFGKSSLDEALLAFLPRVRRRHDESAPPLSPDPRTRFVELEVTTADGRHLRHRSEGLPRLEDPAAKLRDVLGDTATAAALAAHVRSMESAADLDRLRGLLAAISLPEHQESGRR